MMQNRAFYKTAVSDFLNVRFCPQKMEILIFQYLIKIKSRICNNLKNRAYVIKLYRYLPATHIHDFKAISHFGWAMAEKNCKLMTSFFETHTVATLIVVKITPFFSTEAKRKMIDMSLNENWYFYNLILFDLKLTLSRLIWKQMSP